MNTKKTIWLIASLLLVLVLLLTACGGDEATPTEAPVEQEEPMEEEAVPEEEMADVSFAYPPGGYLEKAISGEYAGTTVKVDGPFTNPDDVLFAESMTAFEEATGITVNYIGDKEFEARLSIAVDAGDPPDIADFPQPGLLANFVRQGFVVDPTTQIPEEWLLPAVQPELA